ncbi:hypothetical protein LINGRAHAP2_LOCUS35701, partial [Linum grandiflorum]
LNYVLLQLLTVITNIRLLDPDRQSRGRVIKTAVLVQMMMRRHMSGGFPRKLRNMNSTSPSANSGPRRGSGRRKSSSRVSHYEEESAAAPAAAYAMWVPDPRTGIYFPRGQEWVMEDVPENAARFGQSYWLRNVDGVEKPDPDHGGNADRYGLFGT